MRITAIDVYRLNSPLIKPYHTAFGDFAVFDTTAVVIHAGDARGAGESMAVRGYSWEGPDDVWAFCTTHAEACLGLEPAEARARLLPHAHTFPFSVSPMLTALEVLCDAFPVPTQAASYPLAGIVNVTRIEDVADGVEQLISKGFTTLKMKVGFNLNEDIAKTRLAQKVAAGRALIRLDANQAYSWDDAVAFVNAIDPEGIELLEQPFASDAWEAMERFAPQSRLPLMLDESIYSDDDIERAARSRCARYIKLKVVKSGGMEGLYRSGKRVLDNGMGLIIGNGVATDISCYHELLVCLALGISTAGEMNGYLKLTAPLLPEALGFANGKALLHPHGGIVPEASLLRSQAVEHRTFRASSSL